jgi:hypothetical protein
MALPDSAAELAIMQAMERMMEPSCIRRVIVGTPACV